MGSRAQTLHYSLELTQYAHTAWTTQDGYLKAAVRAIAQTPDGYLWLGTEFGLVRFDGVRFVTWSAGDGQHLPSNNIRSLAAARDGTLWIGTLEGLASWKDGKLTEYAEVAKQNVQTLLEDCEGTIWTGTFGCRKVSSARLMAEQSSATAVTAASVSGCGRCMRTQTPICGSGPRQGCGAGSLGLRSGMRCETSQAIVQLGRHSEPLVIGGGVAVGRRRDEGVPAARAGQTGTPPKESSHC